LATVITNLLSAIPWLGKSLVEFVWGGFSVNSATINRFFSLHFTLPFILAALVAGHLLYLHISGSSNPMGTTSNADRTAFHPYFSFKDLVTVFLFFIIFTAIVFYAPDKLGPIMAVLFCKWQDNYNTICLKFLKIFRTHDINVIINKILLFLVKIETLIVYKFISRKSYFLINYIISSETLCVNTYLKRLYFKFLFIYYLHRNIKFDKCILSSLNIKNQDNNDQFIYWLAGLIDGDGSLLVNKNKALSCEITVHERDVKTLFKIKEKYYGSVHKRSNVKAYRWRVSKRKIIEKLYIDLNGKLITDSKKKQLKNFSTILNIEPILVENYDFDINNAWLSGFIDADGYFSIRNNYTLTLSIGQKTSGILYKIKEKLKCGNVYYDKSGNTYNYAITDLNGIKIILSYLNKYPLKTTKHIDSITFRKLIQYIELKYHYKNNPNKIKIDHLIKLFKNRYKI